VADEVEKAFEVYTIASGDAYYELSEFSLSNDLWIRPQKQIQVK